MHIRQGRGSSVFAGAKGIVERLHSTMKMKHMTTWCTGFIIRKRSFSTTWFKRRTSTVCIVGATLEVQHRSKGTCYYKSMIEEQKSCLPNDTISRGQVHFLQTTLPFPRATFLVICGWHCSRMLRGLILMQNKKSSPKIQEKYVLRRQSFI